MYSIFLSLRERLSVTMPGGMKFGQAHFAGKKVMTGYGTGFSGTATSHAVVTADGVGVEGQIGKLIGKSGFDIGGSGVGELTHGLGLAVAKGSKPRRGRQLGRPEEDVQAAIDAGVPHEVATQQAALDAEPATPIEEAVTENREGKDGSSQQGMMMALAVAAIAAYVVFA